MKNEVIRSVEVEIPPNFDINENIVLERLRIDPTADITEPPVFCSIGGSPTMTAGNFSLLNGKAKSGKTFFLGAIVASFVSNTTQLGTIVGKLPENKRIVLYFDTELSPYHANRTVRRICSLIGKPNPDNLIAYVLRPLTPDERLTAIEEKISHTDNLGVAIIDGVRDLLTFGINDEKEATSLTSKFLNWTSVHDIHLILLLHQNKTDFNVRGHIGTELINKAETTLTVTKDQRTNIFAVSCEYSRDIAFDDFGFTIDDGHIVASDLPVLEQQKGRDPIKITDQKHYEVLDTIFKSGAQLSYSGLQDAIINGFGNTFGQNISRTFIRYYLEKEWIIKDQSGRKTFYKIKRDSF